MNSFTKITAAALVASLVGSFAAQADTITDTAKAKVIQPLDMKIGRSLSFGTFVAGNAGGTVDADPATPTTGTVNSVGSAALAAQTAFFEVTGLPNSNVNIFPITNVVLKNGAGNQMTATLRAVTAKPNQFALNAAGIGSFVIDGTLKVNPNQAVGDYTGTYSVTTYY